MDDNIKRMAFAGFIAKGLVYALTGVLAFLAAFNLGGEKAGKLQILDFLEKQPFGKVLLGVMGIGLICYAVWRFIQSIQDPEHIGNDSKGVVKRVSFFISGLLYLGLGFFAIIDIFKEPSGSGGGSSSSMLTGETGKFIFLGLAVALGIKGIYQFIKAYKGDFLKKFDIKSMADATKRKFIKNMGYAGLISRGILTCIIAYFFAKAAMRPTGSGEELKGTAEAFSFLQENSSGPWLMGVVAAGLVCYGIYMFTMSKYRQFKD
ncbi:DUF1206 domain-containing protein [Pareuzebyella sediminis]|uniref:DUF1206 domain-containing protein n=1 Tax=Pareuzebyella sediminis TaxID=2607998 RepID=UPI0011EBE477|nr:DUF1206 domain-containing protein [Pareuzebyella sediminis]